MQFRLKLIQVSSDIEVVRVAVDGLTLVQVLDIARDTFGADVKNAQIVHETLVVAIEKEKTNPVPINLERAFLESM
jgi:hypothetical protein